MGPDRQREQGAHLDTGPHTQENTVYDRGGITI